MTKTKLTKRTARHLDSEQLAAATGGALENGYDKLEVWINAQTPADWNERKIFNDIFISTLA